MKEHLKYFSILKNSWYLNRKIIILIFSCISRETKTKIQIRIFESVRMCHWNGFIKVFIRTLREEKIMNERNLLIL